MADQVTFMTLEVNVARSTYLSRGRMCQAEEIAQGLWQADVFSTHLGKLG